MTKSFFTRTPALRLVQVLVATGLALSGLAGSARAQSLGVQGDHFTVDGEARFLTFVSYFDAMRATDLAGDLSFIRQQAGFDGIRIFPNWWYYSGSSSGCPAAAGDTLFTDTGAIRGDNGDVLAPSGRLLQLILVLRAAQAQGLIVDVSFTRETVATPGDLTVAEYMAAMGRIAFLLREYRNVLFDIQNERDNGSGSQQLTHREVRDIKNAIKAVDPGRVVMSSGGGTRYVPGDLWNHGSETGFNLRSEVDVIAYHDPRGAGWQDQTTQVVQDLRQALAVRGLPVYLQEPTRWRMTNNACGNLETTDQSDPDPEHFRTALRLAKEAGAAAWTFHTQRAFRLPGTGPLHTQIEALPAGHLERELYLGAGTSKLTGTPASWAVTVQVRVQVNGPGSVTGSPVGISCTAAGGTCEAMVAPGTLVTFTTTPDGNARFEGYDMLSAEASEPCGGTPACTIRILAPTEIGARFSLVPSEKLEFQHTDAIGSIRAVTNEAGVRTVSNDFMPFGEQLPATTGDPFTTRLLFAGKERDAESGLDYFGARYYASRAGRFTTVDPVYVVNDNLVAPQRWNRYVYALNNPFRYVDPDGRWPTAIRLVHQASIDRTLPSLSAEDRRILKEAGVTMDKDHSSAGSSAHAMRAPTQTVEQARGEANAFVRKELQEARRLEAAGQHDEAMNHLGNAMHTLQDATSPAHAGFQVWDEKWDSPFSKKGRDHVWNEFYDPGKGSPLDKATKRAYDYFTGRLELPKDFFGNTQ